jgi:hypothetical protein
MTKSKILKISAVMVVLLGSALLLMVKVHFGYFAKDKVTTDQAEKLVIQRFNSRQFDAIYEDFADDAKKALSREQAVDAMNATSELYGRITEDVEGATTCFPEQVRMVRWLKSSKGTDLTAMMIWYVPGGEKARLVMMQIVPGHSTVNPETVAAHSCSGRAYVAPVARPS